MANEPGYKTRESSVSPIPEFQHVQPPDELSHSQLQATYSKAPLLKTIGAKTNPQAAALGLDFIHACNSLHAKSVDRGLIKSTKIGRLDVDEFLSNIAWDNLQQIKTAQQGAQQTQLYTFAVESEKKRFLVTLGLGAHATTLSITDSKSAILFQMVQEGGQAVFYSPRNASI